jgi:hypothetical protein
MLGLLLLAMPIAVIAGKFNDLYKKNEEREEFNKLQAVNKRQSILHKINTIFAFSLKHVICACHVCFIYGISTIVISISF